MCHFLVLIISFHINADKSQISIISDKWCLFYFFSFLLVGRMRAETVVSSSELSDRVNWQVKYDVLSRPSMCRELSWELLNINSPVLKSREWLVSAELCVFLCVRDWEVNFLNTFQEKIKKFQDCWIVHTVSSDWTRLIAFLQNKLTSQRELTPAMNLPQWTWLDPHQTLTRQLWWVYWTPWGQIGYRIPDSFPYSPHLKSPLFLEGLGVSEKWEDERLLCFSPSF